MKKIIEDVVAMRRKKEPDRYFYARQLGEGCVFLPMLNLYRLEHVEPTEEQFGTRRQWFGKGYGGEEGDGEDSAAYHAPWELDKGEQGDVFP